jgi:hypothetical protein
MDKVQKYNSFNTNTPSSESYRNCPVSPAKVSKYIQELNLIRDRPEDLIRETENNKKNKKSSSSSGL